MEAKTTALKSTAEGEDAGELKTAIAEFEPALQQLGGCQPQGGPQPGSTAGAAAGKGDEDIKDADFEVK